MNRRPYTQAQKSRLTWGLAVSQLFSWGILYYSFAAFLVPMERSLACSRASLSAAFSAGLIVAGLSAPLVGVALERFGGRAVMTCGAALAVLMLALWSFQQSYPVFVLVWLGLGLAQAMTLYEPAFAILHRELAGEAGKAIMRVTLVGGLASTVFIPITYWLIEQSSWRSAALILGALIAIVVIPIAARLPDSSSRPGPPADHKQSARLAPRALLGRSSFWALLSSYTLTGAVFGAMTFHLLPLLAERGLADGLALMVVATIGPMQVIGRFLLLMIFPDMAASQIGRWNAAALPLSLIALEIVPGIAGIAAFAIIYGLSNGVSTIVRGTVTAELYGTQDFARINGLLAMPSTIAKAVGPTLAAVAWSLQQDYSTIVAILAILAFVAAIGFFRATRNAADPCPT